MRITCDLRASASPESSRRQGLTNGSFTRQLLRTAEDVEARCRV